MGKEQELHLLETQAGNIWDQISMGSHLDIRAYSDVKLGELETKCQALKETLVIYRHVRAYQ